MQVSVIKTYFLFTLWVCFNQTADETEGIDQQGDTVSRHQRKLTVKVNYGNLLAK